MTAKMKGEGRFAALVCVMLLVLLIPSAVYAASDEQAYARYKDGELIFAKGDSTEQASYQTDGWKVYTGIETSSYSGGTSVPWYAVSASVTSVKTEDNIAPASMAYWFYGMVNCTSMDLKKLDTSNAVSFSALRCLGGRDRHRHARLRLRRDYRRAVSGFCGDDPLCGVCREAEKDGAAMSAAGEKTGNFPCFFLIVFGNN